VYTPIAESDPVFGQINERLFREIFRTMDAAVLLLPGGVNFGNEKFDTIMPGWQDVFARGQDVEDLYKFFCDITENPDDHIATIGRLRETKQSQETLWYFKNGRTYSTRGFVVNLNKSGDVYAELWILRDITEIEAQIKLFNSTFEMMDDPAILFMPGRPPIGNSAYSNVFPGWQGVYETGGAYNVRIKAFWAKYITNAEEASEQVNRLRKTHQIQELIWHFKNGRELLFKASVVKLSGDLFAELWISQDVTELSNTKRQFNEIFNVMDPAVAILSNKTMIANNAYNEVFPNWEDIYKNALTGDDERDFQTLVAYWDSMITNADEHIKAIEKIRSTHEDVQSIWHFRDGRECIQKGYWLDLGDIGGELWVLTDVSRLYDAMQRANDASLAKSMFLSSMSHEIRTPMNAIIGMTALARKTDDPEKIKRYLDKTEEAGHRLMTLINDVLDMSKIESGKLQISENAFDYVKMINNAVNVINDKAQDKRIAVKIIYKTPITHTVWADELRISQIIVNFLSNAVKFTPELGTITLTTEVFTAENGDRLRVSCTDTGIGINEEAKSKLFNSFEQADNSITRRYGGTGLGLAICRQIVGLMGGEIGVDSTEGEGSTFFFEIPIEWKKELQGANTGSGDFPGSDTSLLNGKRILLVEDVEVNRMIVAALLEETGCTIDEAENGKIAVTMVETNPYDLVLMDVQMPVMDGLTATRKIRTFAPDVPIIAMTANAFKEDADACLTAGMNAHIAKPIDPEAFMGLILEYVKK
jgi:signal transduction histidine kinase/BarA-like signal transduction histidine kinase